MVALLVAASAVARAAPEDDAEAEVDAAACVAACDAALEACRATADADAEKCRKRAFEACEAWCPCDEYVGAAHFACLLECDKCEGEAEDIAAECPDGSAAKATCAAEHRRCKKDCAGGG